MKYDSIIHIYTDGGSRGNPGPSAIGVYITDSFGKEIVGFGKTLGITTNNIAEYKAVIIALEWINNNRNNFKSKLKIHFFMDSRLVYSQLNGLFKVKHPNMKQLFNEVREKEKKLRADFNYSYIPREKNKNADRFVNIALDKEF